LINLSRNIFFYKNTLLSDTFETRINLIFFHLSLIMLGFKDRKVEFPQQIFDNIFQNIEYHFRELGYGDVSVNKQMKNLIRIYYDILLKIKQPESSSFSLNIELLTKYFELKNKDTHLTNKLADYFNKFYNFCFELNEDIVLKGRINFKY